MTMIRPSLLGFLPEEIAALPSLDKPYRGRQIFEGLQKRGALLGSLTDVPEPLRVRLAGEFADSSSRVIRTLRDPDGTVKLQIELSDGSAVECVMLVDQKDRKTACLSTQAGCGMGCKFCRTGMLGLKRNLETAEIVEQFHHLNGTHGPIGNIVFMGMGEPLLNVENLRRSIGIFVHPRGLALSLRRMTVSTCGIVPGIMDLADKGPAVGIAVSLVTADEKLRRKLMPVTNRWGLGELKKAMEYHQGKTGKRLTIEVVLIKDHNDKEEHVRKLKEFLRGLDVIVNLIPWNSIPEIDFAPPSEEAVQMYYRSLEGSGIPSTRRFRRGTKIGGACGQLGIVT
jgi:23S rRNA (adenine2503-C2)-methyltransferase